MVINLLGNLIDLSKIYRISGLRKPNSHRFDDSGESGDDEKDWMHSFVIHFLDRKQMRISAHNDKAGREELKRILDLLMALWTSNQTSIPSIDSKEDKWGNNNIYVD